MNNSIDTLIDHDKSHNHLKISTKKRSSVSLFRYKSSIYTGSPTTVK